MVSTRGDILSFRFTSLNGVLLALASAIILALFWVLNLRDKRDATAKLFLNFSFGFIFILIATLLFSEIILPDVIGLTGVIYIGIFEMGITFVIWLKALKLSKTTAKVSNLIYLAPFLSLFWIHLIVGEKILLSTIIGLVLIVVGIIIQKK
ncbi:MAG: DMT family transporter [Nanoarchaeota archaeon]|nr:DMT family transporter [Nanoarchaeota archaeon]